VPAQPVDATLRQSVDPMILLGRDHLSGCTSIKPKQSSCFLNSRPGVSLAFENPAGRLRARCCNDPLRPPVLPECGNQLSIVAHIRRIWWPPCLRAIRMFNNLFHIIYSLEHDFSEDQGKRVHSLGCRRCALTVRLSAFKMQILQILRDIDFALGDLDE
jgi:hypothetical protein